MLILQDVRFLFGGAKYFIFFRRFLPVERLFQKTDSSNINEVIRAVLNSLFFFTKRFRTHQKAQKVPKTPKSTEKHKKAQKRNQAKTQKRK